MSVDHVCERIRQYAVVERHLSEAYIVNSTKAVRTIITRYGSKLPSRELADRMEIDMRERGRSVNTINFYYTA